MPLYFSTDDWDNSLVEDEFNPDEVEEPVAPPIVTIESLPFGQNAYEDALLIQYIREIAFEQNTIPPGIVRDIRNSSQFKEELRELATISLADAQGVDAIRPGRTSIRVLQAFDAVDNFVAPELRELTGLDFARDEKENPLDKWVDPKTGEKTNTSLFRRFTGSYRSGLTGDKANWFETQRASVIEDFYRSDYVQFKDYWEAALVSNDLTNPENKWLDIQPITSTTRHLGQIENDLRYLWADMGIEIGAEVRTNVIKFLQDVQRTQGIESRQELFDLVTTSIGESGEQFAQITNEYIRTGIYQALEKLPNGTRMVDYLITRPDFDIIPFANQGLNALQLSQALSEVDPGFNTVRTTGEEPTPPIVLPREVNNALDSLGQLPYALAREMRASIVNALDLTNPNGLDQRVASVDLNILLNQQLTDILVALDPRMAEIIDEIPGNNAYAALAQLNISPNTYTLNELQRKISDGIPDTAAEDAQEIKNAFVGVLDNLPDHIAAALSPVLQQNVSAIAEARGLSVAEFIRDRDLGSFVTQSLEQVLGNEDISREMEILAELRGTSIIDLFAEIDATDLNFRETVEAILDLDPTEVRPGETADISRIRGELAELQGRREAAEAAAEVGESIIDRQNRFIAENPELSEQQEQIRQQQQREQIENFFIRQPAGERVAEQVGRSFVGRQRDRIIRELAPQVQDDISRAFRERVERIQQENEQTGAQVLGEVPTAEEFFEQNIEQFLPSRENQLGILRRLQSQDRLTFGGIARRRRGNRF